MDARVGTLEALGLPIAHPSCSVHSDEPLDFVCTACSLISGCRHCRPAHASHDVNVFSVASAACAQRVHLLKLCSDTPAQPGMLPLLRMPASSLVVISEDFRSLAEEQVCELMRSLMAELDALPGNTEEARQRALLRCKDAITAAGGDDAAAASATYKCDAILEEIARAEATKVAALETDISVVDGALETVQGEFDVVRQALRPDALSDEDLVGGAYLALLDRLKTTFALLRRLPSVKEDASAIVGALKGDHAVHALLVAGSAMLGRVLSLDLHVSMRGS